MLGGAAAVPPLPAAGERRQRRHTDLAVPKSPMAAPRLHPGALSLPHRAAPAARCLSGPCSARSTTTGPSWAPPPATAGCPSTEVSPGLVTASPGGSRLSPRHHPNPFPPRSGSPQPLRPQLPGRGAQLLLQLRPGAGRHPLQPRLPGPLRRRALPGGCRDPQNPPGTPRPEPPALRGCLGSPQSVGCDGILGSGSRPDACGHCGSGPGSCVLVHRLFQGSDPSSGE